MPLSSYRASEYHAAIYWHKVTGDRQFSTDAQRELSHDTNFTGLPDFTRRRESTGFGNESQHEEYVDALINQTVENVQRELRAQMEAAQGRGIDLDPLCTEKLGLPHGPSHFLRALGDNPRQLGNAIEAVLSIAHELDLESACGNDPDAIKAARAVLSSESLQNRRAEVYRVLIAQSEISRISEALQKEGVISVPHMQFSQTPPSIENPETAYLVILPPANLPDTSARTQAQRCADIINETQPANISAVVMDVPEHPDAAALALMPRKTPQLELAELGTSVDHLLRTLELQRRRRPSPPSSDSQGHQL